MGISFLLSDKKGTGKTAMAGAMLMLLRDEGKRAAYYKPFSDSPENDCDVAFISRVFDDLDIPAPNPILEGSINQIGQLMESHLSRLSDANDHVVIEMPDSETMSGAVRVPNGLSSLSAKGLFILKYHTGVDQTFLSSVCNHFINPLKGIVFNQVTTHRIGELSRELIPTINSSEFKVLGAIPETRAMLTVTLRQIAAQLNGAWLEEPVDPDSNIAHFLVGGNIMDSGPNYFGRYSDQAVIVRAERPDIQMASLDGDTKCLILTGGGEPSEYIRVEAAKHNVPLFLSSTDTESTVNGLSHLFSDSYRLDYPKMESFKQLVAQHLDLDSLF